MPGPKVRWMLDGDSGRPLLSPHGLSDTLVPGELRRKRWSARVQSRILPVWASVGASAPSSRPSAASHLLLQPGLPRRIACGGPGVRLPYAGIWRERRAMTALLVLVHWLHLLALALWIGGLGALAIILPPGRRVHPE